MSLGETITFSLMEESPSLQTAFLPKRREGWRKELGAVYRKEGDSEIAGI